MTDAAWNAFVTARTSFREMVERLRRELLDLPAAQQKLASSRASPYQVETPVVYNTALDAVTRGSCIRLILVADNPGYREQMAINQQYLVGPSGKLAERFFRDSLGIDFRANVVVLNKTPIHTARTAELRELARSGGPAISAAIAHSQQDMATLIASMSLALIEAPVWIIGYSEMKKGGIFEVFTETLRSVPGLSERVLFFRHFSMNQFAIDLKQNAISGEPVTETLGRMGAAYRKRILG